MRVEEKPRVCKENGRWTVRRAHPDNPLHAALVQWVRTQNAHEEHGHVVEAIND